MLEELEGQCLVMRPENEAAVVRRGRAQTPATLPAERQKTPVTSLTAKVIVLRVQDSSYFKQEKLLCTPALI